MRNSSWTTDLSFCGYLQVPYACLGSFKCISTEAHSCTCMNLLTSDITKNEYWCVYFLTAFNLRILKNFNFRSESRPLMQIFSSGDYKERTYFELVRIAIKLHFNIEHFGFRVNDCIGHTNRPCCFILVFGCRIEFAQ